jgi:O-antigen ligase
VPLPPALRLALSPRVGAIEQILWLDAPANPLTGGPRPLSIDVYGTLWALAIAVAAMAVFWGARDVCVHGGLRRTVTGIAWIGLVLAAVAIAQHATAPRMLYWTWLARSHTAFTPYVNKNYFAAWLIMAIPVTAGYLMARVYASRHVDDPTLHLQAVSDAKNVWLAVSVCLMSAALLTSVSRAGLAGEVAAAICFLWLAHGRVGRRGLWPLVVGVSVPLAVAVAYVNLGMVSTRLTETIEKGLDGGRMAIWRETWPMVKDFWLTGVGAGTYERGMLAYWQHPGVYYVNHAHNEYLQLAAEGGLLLSALVALALVAGVRQIGRALGRDEGALFWIRVGAVSGMVAVAVQGIWDTGLRMPANTILFALLAAIAVHDSR